MKTTSFIPCLALGVLLVNGAAEGALFAVERQFYRGQTSNAAPGSAPGVRLLSSIASNQGYVNGTVSHSAGTGTFNLVPTPGQPSVIGVGSFGQNLTAGQEEAEFPSIPGTISFTANSGAYAASAVVAAFPSSDVIHFTNMEEFLVADRSLSFNLTFDTTILGVAPGMSIFIRENGGGSFAQVYNSNFATGSTSATIPAGTLDPNKGYLVQAVKSAGYHSYTLTNANGNFPDMTGSSLTISTQESTSFTVAAAIPEPSSSAFLLTSAVSALLYRRRRG